MRAELAQRAAEEGDAHARVVELDEAADELVVGRRARRLVEELVLLAELDVDDDHRCGAVFV